jgi:hypothetical protein
MWMKRSVVALHLALSVALLLSACGGGGGSGGSSGGNSGSTPPPTTVSKSNWDELVWDQDNWS